MLLISGQLSPPHLHPMDFGWEYQSNNLLMALHEDISIPDSNEKQDAILSSFKSKM